jgi:glutamate carboxypeptidase
MPLNDLEGRVCDAIAARGERMLNELAEHVAIPTGHNYTAGLERYRALLTERLQNIGGALAFVPGTPRPEWLALPASKIDPALAGLPEQIPATAIVTHSARRPTKRILIAGHIDTVHDPRGSFQKLNVSDDGKTAIGPGAVDMKGGILVALHALEALASKPFRAQRASMTSALRWSRHCPMVRWSSHASARGNSKSKRLAAARTWDAISPRASAR